VSGLSKQIAHVWIAVMKMSRDQVCSGVKGIHSPARLSDAFTGGIEEDMDEL
jgi:hypothetical protein